MNDTNKYINAYIDSQVGMLHDYMGQILQLKTQLRLLNDLSVEKDSTIEKLNNERQGLLNDTEECQRLRTTLEEANKKNEFLTTISNQYSSIKQQLLDTTKELEAAKLALMERAKFTEQQQQQQQPQKPSTASTKKKNSSLDINKNSTKETDDF